MRALAELALGACAWVVCVAIDELQQRCWTPRPGDELAGQNETEV